MEEHYETFTVLIARINRSIKRIKSAGNGGVSAERAVCVLPVLPVFDGWLDGHRTLRAVRRGQGGNFQITG